MRYPLKEPVGVVVIGPASTSACRGMSLILVVWIRWVGALIRAVCADPAGLPGFSTLVPRSGCQVTAGEVTTAMRGSPKMFHRQPVGRCRVSRRAKLPSGPAG
jgi:hypothetical protein